MSGFESFFDTDTVHLDNSEHWFEVVILDITNPVDCKILEVPTPPTEGEQLPVIETNKEISFLGFKP